MYSDLDIQCSGLNFVFPKGMPFHTPKGMPFHAKMGTIKNRNSMDPTEEEEIKNRW